MTNHWVDLKNSDCFLMIGSNAAENHPASFTWINKAREERGAKLIVVDPRFTRSAATANLYAPLRSGTDIAFFGGMMNYVFENELYHEEYVRHFTNATFLIDKNFKGPGELEGLFSGYDPDKRTYDTSSWAYRTDEEGNYQKDMTMKDPFCVFQLLKKHYSRYDMDTVSKITGMPKDKLEEVYKLYTATGAPEKTGTIMYAMGQTQHTVGTQNVRCMAMIQLLLGNVGRPGGGVNALRGESNVQGSTDMCVLFHIIPAYMATPSAANHKNLAEYLEKETPKAGYWVNKPKFLISLLKAWWGENATEENDFAFDYLGKIAGNHSWISIFEEMYAGKIKGLWIMGQNPAVGGPNARFERAAMGKLDWMVVQELVATETVSFWQAPDVKPTDIQTEVFVLPAADALEKQGTISTSGRLIQYRPQVAPPPGDAREDIWMMDAIYQELKRLYEEEGGAFPAPVLELNWWHGSNFDKICEEINGYWTKDVTDEEGNFVGRKGEIVVNFTQLRADGSTASGNWLYSGYWYPLDDGEGHVMSACKRRGQKDPGDLGIYPYWAFSWPVNRRIIYNRCSADSEGKPWAKDKALIWWDEDLGQWTGYDVPDFGKTVGPTKEDGSPNPAFTNAFIMMPELKGCIWAARNEGPLPEHYEPVESPVQNILSAQQNNPAIKLWDTAQGEDIGDNLGTPNEFPIVGTTYRVCEHWQAGGMSRWLGWLAETQPDMFVEMSKELAAEKGIQNGDKVIVKSARGNVEAVAIVTPRFKPFGVNGQTVHQVGLPWHYGWGGKDQHGRTALARGDSANKLTPHVGDANTMIPEYKAFLVNIEKAV
jgi:formate dehydrogenase-N alpha subunit